MIARVGSRRHHHHFVLVEAIVGVEDEVALQVHDAHANDQHERHDELQANQRGAQKATLGRQTERAFQHQGRREGRDVVRRIGPGQQSHHDADEQGDAYQPQVILQQDTALHQFLQA